MNFKEWEELEKADYDKWLEEYRKFFCEENRYNCECCPKQDEGRYSHDTLPCGQYHCYCDYR